MKRLSTNEILAKNIAALMERHGLVQSALSKKSGVAQTTVSLYLNPDRRQPSKTGKVPSAKLTEVEALARALDVPLVQLLSAGMQVDSLPMAHPNAANEDYAPVRLVDAAASAGRGEVICSNDVKKELMFRRDWLKSRGAKPDAALAFPVKGDSMVDDCIPDGSIVLANTAKTDPLPGKTYVLWLDGELYVKQLAQESELWFARSRNKAKAKKYPDIQIDLDGRLVGQVFWCGFEV